MAWKKETRRYQQINKEKFRMVENQPEKRDILLQQLQSGESQLSRCGFKQGKLRN